MTPLLAKLPPADDRLFISHVVSVGQWLKPDRQLAYWRARRSSVRLNLHEAGWSEAEAEAAISDFETAVRDEAERRRQRATFLRGEDAQQPEGAREGRR